MSRPQYSTQHQNYPHSDNENDLYGVLGIAPSASNDEIRNAYKKAALRWHPDKNPDQREHAERMFKAVARAYEVLSNPTSRQEYDAYGIDGVGAATQGRRRASDRPPGGEGFSFGAHGSHPFRDPFEIFHSFFGASDPLFGSFFGGSMFDDPFAGNRRGNFGPRPGSLIDSLALGGMGFGGPQGFESMFSQGGGSSFFSSSSFSSSGGRGNTRSQQTTTQIVNGRKVTRTVTRTEGPDGVVHEDVDEKVEELPQQAPRRPQLDGYSFDAVDRNERRALPSTQSYTQRSPVVGSSRNHSRSSVFY